ncbi:hypothetical protein Back11_06900 [Paenibacillus baekrokdamisoli]|uniref:Uncharacterized protein n=1 Tax=Paenibacillus baekrokdamisoli TaxID=1712516 RepID=A0A3G9ITG5_9BACL|nr:DUF6886 family protein [Paenibacillus baekrokdamisoli]MBB3067468.1 hypothetical protein [Paenibacillus baekrokdamisoli]BBH19345.1 hypothetical protein Back11_06900 [Paenibacillus baekrokdamisoli]
MKLYHFSEESNITRFEPRQLDYRKDEPAMIWTIDDFHAPHYFLPRDCPRVCVWPKEDTSEEDLHQFFGHSSTNRLVAIETGWYETVKNTQLYQYTFNSDAFTLYNRDAGYYITKQPVIPLAVEPLDDLLAAMIALGIELRVTPSLIPLRNSILNSTVNFSMIRMRNIKEEKEHHE